MSQPQSGRHGCPGGPHHPRPRGGHIFKINPFGSLDRGLKRLLAYSERVDELDYNPSTADYQFVQDEEQANLVTSATGSGDYHLPVLDLDVPHTLVPSSTPGHAHLYLDVAVPWDKYVRVLDAMAAAGLLEYGYVEASKNKGATMVRKPGVTKPTAPFRVGDRVRVLDVYPEDSLRGRYGIVTATRDDDAPYPVYVRIDGKPQPDLFAERELERVEEPIF